MIFVILYERFFVQFPSPLNAGILRRLLGLRSSLEFTLGPLSCERDFYARVPSREEV
jgi:hypothetical protein